ncbi:MAG TPA: SRPBCC family protein [Cryomorphaceae bacterium]|nr:SRPBCC family protein [Cryomorphaceae bacterium]
MKIESKKVSVPAQPEKVFEYISDLNNFRSLLPEDRISEWESNQNYCSFKVQGTATIDLKLEEKDAFSRLLLRSGDKSPFSFTLEVFLVEANGQTEAHQLMNADINPFLKMMVEKPLANLFNFIADRLAEKFSS